eukprot:m.272751 g.272751  ORF g.272751 m.272751 type:complete len:1251 (+) comp11088_c0_seq1:32-3784(+)
MSDRRDEDDLFAGGSGSRRTNFKVVVRVRPFVQREEKCQPCVQVDSKQSITVTRTADVKAPGERPSTASSKQVHAFSYDRVFDELTEQSEIYLSAVRPVVYSVLEGYNGSIIAYGQTGTGKTHTIEGDTEGDARGIIPRSIDDVFASIQDKKQANSKWLVRISFLQIYNEKIYDLLAKDNSRDLRIRESGDGGIFVEDLSEHVVREPEDVYELLKLGKQQRISNSTRMNRESSRSHAVFTVIIEHAVSHDDGRAITTVGKLHLVDLAGSERFEANAASTHQKETRDINTSLSAFGKVVLALTSRQGRTHTPYRDSKLTRILQDSLGGNCLTTMITTISPASVSYFESVSSLKFANRAKSVKNVAVVNEDKNESAMLSHYQSEIARLRDMLKNKNQVDPDELERLQSINQQARLEKSVIVTELARQQREVQQAQEEKLQLERRIAELEKSCLEGGEAIEHSDEFQLAVKRERERLENEQQSQMAQIEEERRRLEEEKAKFEREREQFQSMKAQHAFQPSPPKTPAPQVSSAAIRGGPGNGGGPPLASRLQAKFGQAAKPHQRVVEAAAAAGRPAVPPPLRRNSSLNASGATPNEAAILRRATTDHDAVNAWRNRVARATTDSSDSSSDDDDAFFQPSAPSAAAPRRARTAGYRRASTASSNDGSVGDDSWAASRSPPAHPQPQQHQLDQHQDQRVTYRPSTAPVRRPSTGASSQSSQSAQQSEALDQYAAALMDPGSGIPLSTKRVRLTSYRNCFSGSDGATWFMSNMEGITTLEQAKTVGQNLLDLGVIAHIKGDKEFIVSDGQLYQFRPRGGASASSPSGQSRPGTARSYRRLSSAGPSRRASLQRAGSAASLASALSVRTSSSSVASFSTAHSADTQSDEDFFEDDGFGTSEIHLAAAKGLMTQLKQMCEDYGLEHPDGAGRTPLMYAVIGNKSKPLRFLLRAGADINACDDNGSTALLWAACRGCRDAVRTLLREGADIEAADMEGRTALHWATKLNRTDTLEALLKQSFKTLVNRHDAEQLTPLHWAVMVGHSSHVDMLLKNQADVMETDAAGRTPIHYAISHNSLECLQVLCEASPAAVNIADSTGRTALHIACGEGSMDSICLLLAVPGIDVNSTDQRLTTALHWAAVCNRPEVCRILLQRGARLMARDAAGMTPLHYTLEKGFTECTSILQRYGGGLVNPLERPTAELVHPMDMASRPSTSMPMVPSRRSMYNGGSGGGDLSRSRPGSSRSVRTLRADDDSVA